MASPWSYEEKELLHWPLFHLFKCVGHEGYEEKGMMMMVIWMGSGFWLHHDQRVR